MENVKTEKIAKADSILKVEHLNFRIRKRQILDDVSFEVPQGSLCAFIGDNGAGKTTTIKSILGLYKAQTQEVKINGKNIKDVFNDNIIGYVPEKENFSKTKVMDWLIFMASLSNVSKEKCLPIAESYLKKFGILDVKNLRLFDLSSGQKKIIMIIQAFMNPNNQIFFMDEPTENLDPKIRQIFYDMVSETNKEGKSFFISTHNLDEIKRFATYVVFIKHGKIVYSSHIKQGTDLYKIYNSL
jgi:ABC-2 type transport system ATP-binding protein